MTVRAEERGTAPGCGPRSRISSQSRGLWSGNTPCAFWHCEPAIPANAWRQAMRQALPLLGLPAHIDELDELPEWILGEGQFGPDHWRLRPLRELYYDLKPALPRVLTLRLRRAWSAHARRRFQLAWPIEERYVRFLWGVLEEAVRLNGHPAPMHRPLWPAGHRFAFVLTHDVESHEGQEYLPRVADLEESLGFRSSFNLVPERYDIDWGLIDDLRQRGFEIGVHGLRHDGKLFRSCERFMRRAQRINDYLRDWGAVGFRAPLTQRHPQWMQALDIEYDLSFFDTDPFEPIPGGTMSIWPFLLGHFVELPYTLVQDHTLTHVLGERTPRIWLDKVAFIEAHQGMALLNTHPDYLRHPHTWRVYVDFLRSMTPPAGHWHALPREVARWWRARMTPADSPHDAGDTSCSVT